jgi:hypothetical protein
MTASHLVHPESTSLVERDQAVQFPASETDGTNEA